MKQFLKKIRLPRNPFPGARGEKKRKRGKDLYPKASQPPSEPVVQSASTPDATSPTRGCGMLVRAIQGAVRRIRRFIKPKVAEGILLDSSALSQNCFVSDLSLENVNHSCISVLSSEYYSARSEPFSKGSSSLDNERTSESSLYCSARNELFPKGSSSLDNEGPSEASLHSIDNSQPTSTNTLTLDSFDPYWVLGKGGFGKVVLVTHPATRQLVAVKIVKKIRCLFTKNFMIERDVMQLCRNCRFITALHGTFQTEKHLFFVMEFLSGGDMYKLIQDSGPFDESTVRFYAAQILCGLKHLHSLGILHRDIKPDNILLDKFGHAKITDFGLSVLDVTKSTKIKGFVGTDCFAAPEVISFRKYNMMADFFSFGVCLYLMTTSNIQFDDKNEWSKKLRRKIDCWIVRYPKSMTCELKDFMSRLLCKSPKKREKKTSDIERHPFFSSIDWAELREGRIAPPNWRPAEEIGHRETLLWENLLYSKTDEGRPPLLKRQQKLFEKFSFVGEVLGGMTQQKL